MEDKGKYWYKITVYWCPVCGREEVNRERQYTPRPENRADRYFVKQVYDWCNEVELMFDPPLRSERCTYL